MLYVQAKAALDSFLQTIPTREFSVLQILDDKIYGCFIL